MRNDHFLKSIYDLGFPSPSMNSHVGFEFTPVILVLLQVSGDISFSAIATWAEEALDTF